MYKISRMKKILIVEDLNTFVEKEKSILNRADFRIFTAASGEEALAVHRMEKMDLIIADLDMPGMSGDALCSSIRKDAELKQVSLVIVCANRKSDIERSSNCKANAYVTKPIDPPRLLETVTRLLDIPERKSYRVILKVTIRSTAKSDSFFCSSRNISASGLLIETDRVLEKDDRITCSFFLPKSERIIADAQVMRVDQNPDATFLCGVRFIDLGPGPQSAIEEFVKSWSKRSL